MKFKKPIMIIRPFSILRFCIWGLLSVCLIGGFASCSKSDDPLVEEVPDVPTEESMFNRLITVKNFGEQIPQGNVPTTDLSPIYYSLEQNQPVKSDYQRTSRWDLSFSNIYRSFINCNNLTAGYGKNGPGKGGILIVEKKFEDVINIPADELFRQGEKAYGSDDSGKFGEGIGWYLYDYDGTQLGNGVESKKHIAYPIEDHTLVVRTAKGNYAKVKIMSIYKDMLDPADWYTYGPIPYFTFQYVLAKAGSTKFEISK